MPLIPRFKRPPPTAAAGAAVQAVQAVQLASPLSGDDSGGGWRALPWCALGAVGGLLWHLQQMPLNPPWLDATLLLVAVLGGLTLGWARLWHRSTSRNTSRSTARGWTPWALGAAMLLMAVLTMALCGLRAQARLADRLDPALEGRDLRVVGVVASMPQAGDTGVRFRFQVESARFPSAARRGTPAPQSMRGTVYKIRPRAWPSEVAASMQSICGVSAFLDTGAPSVMVATTSSMSK